MSAFETKLALGQEAWGIGSRRFERQIRCTPCRGTGAIEIEGEQLTCPKCHGRSKHPQYAGDKCVVDSHGRVGSIEINVVAEGRRHHHDNGTCLQVTYMLDATGVGSGTLWRQEKLFASREEAEAECARRNSSLPEDEP